jgi:hypothetical protein
MLRSNIPRVVGDEEIDGVQKQVLRCVDPFENREPRLHPTRAPISK